MNPLDLVGGGVTGGISPSSSASSSSGPATGTSGTGVKNINLGGGNPNTVGGFFSNPLVLVTLVAGVYLIARR